ncbi:MAG: hypothetical protein QGG40_21310, partial [Myxococcota bacterium]|nr:hypothetical protein [Myxococcota bacterium]
LPSCTDNEFELNGFGSYDLDGDDLTYEWSLVSTATDSVATEDDLDDRALPNPTFTWDVVGTYVFQLQVSDGEEWSAPDLVSYTIASDAENTAPIANAGEDYSVTSSVDCVSSSYEWTCPDCEEESLEVDGSGSYDPDGGVVTFFWSDEAENVTFDTPHSAITSATIGEQAAEYGVDNELEFEISLSVSDCLETSTDTVTISYTCSGEGD